MPWRRANSRRLSPDRCHRSNTARACFSSQACFDHRFAIPQRYDGSDSSHNHVIRRGLTLQSAATSPSPTRSLPRSQCRSSFAPTKPFSPNYAHSHRTLIVALQNPPPPSATSAISPPRLFEKLREGSSSGVLGGTIISAAAATTATAPPTSPPTQNARARHRGPRCSFGKARTHSGTGSSRRIASTCKLHCSQPSAWRWSCSPTVSPSAARSNCKRDG